MNPIELIQTKLISKGYQVTADGVWGPETETALNHALGLEDAPVSPRRPVWSAKVSQTFVERVLWICDDLGVEPDHLMACMAFESGESFKANKRNPVSSATGLIQFMSATAKGLGTTTAALAAMTAEDQLKYVYKYFLPFKGRLKSLEDVYMAILMPVAVGKPLDYNLFSASRAQYLANKGLDKNRDGKVTKAEAAAKVREKLDRGKVYR